MRRVSFHAIWTVIALATAFLVLPTVAVADVRRGEFDSPMREIALLARSEPEQADRYLLSCLAFLSINIERAALTACDHAVASDPYNTDALKMRGGLLLLLGEKDRARVDFSIVISREPKKPDGYYLRGRVYFGLHRYADAQRDFDTAVMLGPQDPDALSYRALFYQELRQYGPSIADFGRAIAAEPTNAALWNGRCWVRMLANRQLLLALKDCRRALELDPESSDVLDSLGWLWLRLDNSQESIRDFNTALSVSPRHATSLFGRGFARLQTGCVFAGRSDIRAAKVIEPDIEVRFRSYGFVPRGPVRRPIPRPNLDRTTQFSSLEAVGSARGNG